jgi:hypothetical protein
LEWLLVLVLVPQNFQKADVKLINLSAQKGA